MNIDMNCLSYWFPKIHEAGLPVPRTEIVTIGHDASRELARCLEGGEMTMASLDAVSKIEAAVKLMGRPCFLRTGQTSGKHEWNRTCFIDHDADVRSHILAIIEYSELAGLFGLPSDVWAVREMLPTQPIMVCDRYGMMPVCREFRFFVSDGRVLCRHPYWPLESLVDGMKECPANLRDIYRALSSKRIFSRDSGFADPMEEPTLLAAKAGMAVGGSWSVDVLDTQRGWFVTDMAVASDSWHWPGCEKATKPDMAAA